MIEIDGIQYRNLIEQVAKNQKDIENLQSGIKISGFFDSLEEVPEDLEEGYSVVIRGNPYNHLYVKTEDGLEDAGEWPARGPQGIQGEQGQGAVIGNITASASAAYPGIEPKVTVTQTPGGDIHFAFSIPEGYPGTKGDAGPRGVPGPSGRLGPRGPRGEPSFAVRIETTVESISDLPSPSSYENPIGVGMLVGESAPYSLWIIQETSLLDSTLIWKNLGPFSPNSVVVDQELNIASNNAVSNAAVCAGLDDLDNDINYIADHLEETIQNEINSSDFKAWTEKEIQNLIYEVIELKEIVFETVAASLNYYVEYAADFTIPEYIIDDGVAYPVLNNAVAQVYKIYGRSVAWNQIVQNGNFESTSGWTSTNASFSVADNVATILATAQYGGLTKGLRTVVGHKYLVVGSMKSTSTGARISTGGLITTFACAGSGDWETFAAIGTSSQVEYQLRLQDFSTEDFLEIQYREIKVSDLNVDFPGDVPTSISDPRIQAIINGNNEGYDAGTIKNAIVEKIESYDSENSKIGEIDLTQYATEGQRTLKSAGTARDYFELVEQQDGTFNLIRHNVVESVDFGTREWNYRNTGAFEETPTFEALISGMAQANNNKLSALYKTAPYYTYSSLSNMSLSGRSNNSNLYVRNDTYTSAAAFKTASSGVMFNCELANPTTEVIATGLLFDEVSAIIKQGGAFKITTKNAEYGALPSIDLIMPVKAFQQGGE